MSSKNEHNELDQFLRESFEGHTIEPAEELWKGIEQQLAPKVVPIHKYSRLKLALYSSAIIIAGLLATLAILTNRTQNTPVEKRIETVENTEAKKESTAEISIPQTKEILQNAPILSTKQTQNSSDKNAGINKTKTENISIHNFEKNEKTSDVSLEEISYLPAKNNRLFEFSDHGNLAQPHSHEKTKNTSPVKNNKPVHNKSNSTRSAKTKHISAKTYYAQKAESANSSKFGSLLNNFVLKANVTPTLTTRSLNNLQNVSDMEFDQNFFKNTESPGIVLNGGLELSYQINPKWSIYTGAKLFNYLIHIETGNNQNDILGPDQVRVPSSAGNLFIRGNGIGNLQNQALFNTKLKLRYLDIPVVTRIHLKQMFYVDGGLKYSYLLSENTKSIVNDSDVKLAIEKIDGLKKNNFGLVLGTGFNHTSPSGFGFEIGPEINFNFNNLNPKAGIICKPLSIGLKASLYFKK